LLVILALQTAVTLVRFKTQYFDDPFGEAFGRRNVLGGEGDKQQASQLEIDPTGQSVFSGLRGSYGTIPGGLTAKLFLVLLPFSILLSFRNPIFSRPWLFLLLSTAGVLALFFTFSRASIVVVPIIISACCWVAVRQGYLSRRAGWALFGAGIIVICAVTPTLYIQINRKMENVDIRFEQYETAWAMIRSNPILGVGLNNSSGVAREYARYSRSLVSPINNATDQPIHSYYLTLLVELGVVGPVLYLGFFFATWRDAVRLSSAGLPDVRFYASAVAIAFVGIAAGVLFNPMFEDALYTLLWLYAAMIAVLARMNQTDARYGETAPAK
jgi:O-antigen ligase